jgi:hypothetical protein
MGTRNAADEATTYLLESAELAEVVDLVQALRARGVEIPARRPALVDGDGNQLDLCPGLVMGALKQQSNSCDRPETILPDLLSRLAAAGVARFAADARRHLPPSRR